MKEDIVTMILRKENLKNIENWILKKYFNFEILKFFLLFEKKLHIFSFLKKYIGDTPGLRFYDL